MIRNERGIITVDFIFSMVLILGFTSLLFVLSFTLSVASLTQYVTFAAARNYAVAHLDLPQQEARGRAKYKELIENPVFSPLYKNGWYQVDGEPGIGDHTKIVPGMEGAVDSGMNAYWGVGTNFTAKVLDFQIPMFGSTVPDGDGSGSGFKTYLGSYLGREPSAAECLEFTASRWEAIRKLGNYSSGTKADAYFPMADDGC